MPRVLHAIEMLQSEGANVELCAPNRYVATCNNERHVNRIGVCLFHTHLSLLARVVGVSGIAQAEAGAYHFPKTRAERKG